MFDSLFGEIGAKLKNLAKVLFVLSAISFVCLGLYVMSIFADFDRAFLGFILLIVISAVGFIISWLSVLMLYAIGEIVDYLDVISKNTKKIALNTNAGNDYAHSSNKSVSRCPVKNINADNNISQEAVTSNNEGVSKSAISPSYNTNEIEIICPICKQLNKLKKDKINKCFYCGTNLNNNAK